MREARDPESRRHHANTAYRTTTTKTAPAAAPKGKTTRSKKIERDPEPEVTEDLDEPDELQEEGPAPTARKPTRKATTTSKTDSKPAPKATKATTTRATKAKAETEKAKPVVEKAKTTAEKVSVANEKAKPATAKAKSSTEGGKTATQKTKSTTEKKAEPKLATQSRATRATRATEAKGKAPPLSPKKVTQVSRAPARNTRTASDKQTNKKVQPRASNQPGRPRARRNISDENAVIPDLQPPEDDEFDEIKVTQPKKVQKPQAAPSKKVEPAQDISHHSTPDLTRPTTPIEQSRQAVKEGIDQNGEAPEEEPEEIPESESEVEEESKASGDELMGPKTPMKRTSPVEEIRPASTRKDDADPLDIDGPMKTPVRRFAVLGTQKGTPQTQKPYCKPAVPMSAQPMTVARARHRAMVFPDLQPFSIDRSRLAKADAENDPDETIVVEDLAERHTEDKMDTTQDITEDSVIIVRRSSPVLEKAHKTPKPETVVWENVTIPFDFDTQPRDASQEEMTDEELDTSIQQEGRPSLDATVHLSEFIDVKSLSESPEGESDEKSPALEESLGYNSSPHDLPSSAQAEEASEVEPALEESFITSPQVSGEAAHQPSSPSEDLTLPLPTEEKRCDAAIEHELDKEKLDEATEESSVEKVTPTEVAVDDEDTAEIPSYARPTLASRRKSLPAPADRDELLKAGDRRRTDGASLLRLGRTPEKPKASVSNTPVAQEAKTPSTSAPSPADYTPASKMLFAQTPSTSVPQSVKRTPAERFPGLPSRQTYEEVVDATPGEDVAEQEPMTPQPAQERFPGLPSRETYDDNSAGQDKASIFNATKTPQQPEERFPGLPSRHTYEQESEAPEDIETPADWDPATPQPAERFPGLPSRQTYDELPSASGDETPVRPEVELRTPQTAERFPGLPSKRSYEEHAKTAMPQTRFQTPPPRSVKRPATTQKPVTSLRKVALKASATPMKSKTPAKTPLKAAAMTPGNEPMTPHPAAPLRGVVALVEVFTSDGGNATPAFVVLLQRLGAKTTKNFSERVTHLVFKEGSPTTLQRLRVHNKQVAETGIGTEMFCVNSRWVSDCETEGRRMDEHYEEYAVDVEDVPRAGKRRRKSMEPSSLLNVGGSVIRDRKSSLGRLSLLGRTPMKMDSSPEEELQKTITPVADKENSISGAESGEDSPVTPAYLAAPDSLIQQTAPLNRVRKLDFTNDELKVKKNRRLTSWDAGEF